MGKLEWRRQKRLPSWKRFSRECRMRSGNADTGSWFFLPWISKLRLVRTKFAIGQVLVPHGPWLVTMGSSKGKRAGSNSWSLSQQLCICQINDYSGARPHCGRAWSLTAHKHAYSRRSWMGMIWKGVLIWLTVRLLAKGKEEKDSKRLEIKRPGVVVSCFKIISSCAPKIGKIQGRYGSRIGVIVVGSGASHYLHYCNKGFLNILDCLSLCVCYFHGEHISFYKEALSC